MITRMTGVLERVEGTAAVIETGGGLAYEVLVPVHLAEGLSGRVGERVTLHTLEYLEGQGQGTSFVPRLIGFARREDRSFFELFTTVKGLGNKRALRAMAMPPSRIARAIVEKDARALQSLPEIGKRLAETVIAELHGKVEGYLSEAEERGLEAASRWEAKGALASEAREAMATLVALGEREQDAEQMVRKALARAGDSATSESLVTAALAGRG
ncbi:MAG: hypothetical protein KF866_09205 [Phycisphaeraceae bacterium]|nr:hypothetical protein [Phycisphaeraceae bacterium]